MLSPQYSTYAAMSKSYNELMYFKLYRSHENPIADTVVNVVVFVIAVDIDVVNNVDVFPTIVTVNIFYGCGQ